MPVRLLADEHPGVARRLSLIWTPTLTVLQWTGATVRQWIGFLPPEAFVIELQLALALSDLRRARATAALARLDSLSLPEALYWKGVAAYRATRDKAELWDVWRQLTQRYPGSPWSVRTTLLEPGWVEHPARTAGL